MLPGRGPPVFIGRGPPMPEGRPVAVCAGALVTAGRAVPPLDGPGEGERSAGWAAGKPGLPAAAE